MIAVTHCLRATFLLTRTSFQYKLDCMKNHSVTPIASPGQRAASYWFVDGLPEIVYGLALLMIGASALLWRIYAPNPWMKFYFVFVAVGNIFLFWKGSEVLDFVKSHVTYPRTGYVQPPEESASPEPLITLSLRPGSPAGENVTSFGRRTVMVIWWSFFIAMPAPPGRWLVPIVMLALAATLYAMNLASERPYRWWSVVILALTGLICLWVDIPPLLQPLLPLLFAGGVASGAGCLEAG